MQSIQVQIPTQPRSIRATLHYETDYLQGQQPFDFLHQIRQASMWFNNPNGDTLEEAYWHNLEKSRHDFAAACCSAIGAVDVLIDPPSLRGYHRPYLSAFKVVYPRVHWLVFRKNAAVNVNVGDLDGLCKAVEFVTDCPRDDIRKVRPSEIKRILIADDVYATGATAAVIVEILWTKKLPPDVDVHIAAPLRIPPELMEAMKDVIPK
jgi:hypothetical protein